MDDRTVEAISAAVHATWMVMKRSRGVGSRLSEQGEELMKPYADLSEAAKDLDRGTVRAVLAALPEAGFELRRAIPNDPVQRGHGPGTIPPGAMADQGPGPYIHNPTTLAEARSCPTCHRPPSGFKHVGEAAARVDAPVRSEPKCPSDGCPGVRGHYGPCLPEMENPCPV